MNTPNETLSNAMPQSKVDTQVIPSIESLDAQLAELEMLLPGLRKAPTEEPPAQVLASIYQEANWMAISFRRRANPLKLRLLRRLSVVGGIAASLFITFGIYSQFIPKESESSAEKLDSLLFLANNDVADAFETGEDSMAERLMRYQGMDISVDDIDYF